MFSYLRRGPGFYPKVAALAAPIILQNLITSALGMADTFMVGLLGELPMAAVTLANIPVFVVQLFFFGVQSGSTVLISQYWGKQDLKAINRVMGVAAWTVSFVSVAFALILFFCPLSFLGLFGNDQAVVALAAEYGRIVGFSYILNGITLMYIAAYRSMENPQLGMYMLAASMSTNTFLNWVFIFGKLGAPALGVRGAALATLLSRVVEFAIMAGHICLTRGFRLDFGLILRPGAAMIRKFIRYGGPVVCNETMWGLGTALYTTIMGHMENSAEILAAYTIAGNVEKICMVVAFGISGTASILIGREIGAGRPQQVYPIGLALDTLALGAGIILGVLMFFFTRFCAPAVIFPLFQLSPGSCQVAATMLYVQAAITPLRDFNNCNIVGVLRGGGDVRAATLIDLCPLWLVAIPLAAVTGLVLRMGILWVYLAISAEQFIKCSVGIWRLRSGKWINDLTRPAGQEKELTAQ